MWPFKFAMRRKRGLPHVVVYLLSSSPKNGVELMDEIQSMTRGWWRPTPGSIYPLLKDLTDQGVVKKREDGRYELTPRGKNQAEVPYGWRHRSAPSVDEMVGQMNSFVSYMEDLKPTDAEGLAPHREAIKNLAKRLSELTDDEKSASG